MKLKSLVLLVYLLAIGAPTLAVAADVKDQEFASSMDRYLADDKNLEKISDALERFFKKKRDEQEKTAAEAEVKELEEQFKNPIKVDPGNSPARGDKNAKITIVEFSDFQCPYCQRAASTMEELMKEYPNQIKLVFKNMPLPFHSEAEPAAKAALAAHEQGKFWEMHDELFANQQRLGAATYEELAKKIGLDVEKFKRDMNDPKLQKAIEEDKELGKKLGVQGTPGFFVNGVQVRGARPAPYFKNIIDRWLKQG